MTNLFIMTDFGTGTSTDNGTRPYTGTTPIWDNTSIFMEGGSSQTSTTVGTATTIRVRVSNSSNAAIPNVSVDAYVMNPFVGPFDASHALVRLHGFADADHPIGPDSGTPSPTDGHVVPCLVQDLDLGPIPWTPTDSQLASSTDGHLCLVANAYADGDGAPAGGTTAFDIAADPHQGQRNIALLAKSQQLKLQIFPARDGGATALDIHSLTGTQALGPGERWLLRSRSNISKMDGRIGLGIPSRRSRPAVPLTFSRKSVRGQIEVDGLDRGDLHRLAGVARNRPDTATRGHRRAQWGEGRYVLPERDTVALATVDVERDDAAGSLQAFDIVQRDAAGHVIGGFRILSLQE